MIALLDKFLRKWLLGLAVTVRNQAQVMIAKMESVEAEKGKGADRKTAPDAARSARSGEPPAHWVRLVKRHAPELLHPGPPYASPRESVQVLESEDGMDELSADDMQEPPSATGALKAANARTRGVPTLALNLPRLLKDHDDLRSRRLKPDDMKEISGFGGPREAAAMSAKTQQADSSQTALQTTQAGSVDGKRLQSSSAGAEQSPSRRFLRPERNDMPGYTRPSVAGTREAEARAARASAASRSPSAAGPIQEFRAAGMQRKNVREDAGEKIGPLRQGGGRDVQFDRQAADRQGDFRINTRMPAQKSVIPETAYESKPRPSDYFSEQQSASDSESVSSATQVKRRGDDLRQALKIGLVNEQPKAHPPEDDLKIDAKRSRSAKFRWPSLPGEKNYKAAEASHLNPAWPDLPEEQSAGAASLGHQIEPQPSEEKPRNIERLRRLDEEQRGMSWSASRF